MLAAASVALTPSLSSAAVIYVRAGASGARTGASWADALADVQAALAAANPGDQIWVAAGVYHPSAPPPVGSRAASFVLRSGVALYGGFHGDETAMEQRDWTVNLSILSGDLAGDDAPGFVNTSENSYHVVVALDVDDTAVLDGFVVTAGRADGVALGPTPASQDQGSGVNVYTATPRLINCTISGNWSSNHGAVNDHGDTTLVNCVFRGNFAADHGAGLYMHHHSMTSASGCLFVDNITPGNGAGAYCISMDGATVTGCTFIHNTALQGGGLYCAPESVPVIAGCSFTENTGTIGGAGVYVDAAAPIITGCAFLSNTAGVDIVGGDGGAGGSGGGGVWASGGSAVIVRGCTFAGNQASFGGGVYIKEDSVVTVADCAFTANHAHEAGGLYNLTSDATVTGCTFTANTVTGGAFSVGGAVSSYFATLRLSDSAFVANAAQLGGGAVYNEGDTPCTITGCTFRGNTATTAPDGWGGALLNGYFTTTAVTNCAFAANAANRGGAIFNHFASNPFIASCTLAGDTAPEGASVFSIRQSTAVMAGCVIWGIPSGGGGVIDGEPITVRYSCVRGGYAGTGNVTTDPLLVRLPAPGPDGRWGTDDDDPGDLSVAPGSPCIDAGDNTAVPPAITTDLAGRPRFRDDPSTPDTGVGPAPVVDIGAYELQGVPCRADFNGDGALNVQDFLVFLSAYAHAEPRADINGDGAVRIDDFLAYLALYAVGCR
jgi:hypothetical protein